MGTRSIIALSVGIAVLVGLVLLVMMIDQGLSVRSGAATLMIFGFAVFVVGGMLYTGRAIWQWSTAQTPRYLLWERGVVIAALLLNVWGLVLLEAMLHDAGDSSIARLGMVTYVFGAVIIVVAETAYLDKRETTREWNYTQVVLYVVLAFLAQAAFGVALLHTELVADWAGWFAIIWNLAWLVILSIFSPHNIYFPVLHHVAPLLIGIVLLA